jgi:hypothetical protein
MLPVLLPVLPAACSFASAAGPVDIFKHNVFIPHQQLKGKFNKVRVAEPAATPALR